MAGPNRSSVPKGRLVLLVGGLVALLAGLDGAATSADLSAPIQDIQLASLHGLLMVFGFLGLAITLVRATAMQVS